ncbi:MAG TPA: OmpH family outer membrane protein [Vicinamibacterales bacterium]|nr:OmpH family outer membrane protein [Vicinamibacterales bacterium]
MVRLTFSTAVLTLVAGLAFAQNPPPQTPPGQATAPTQTPKPPALPVGQAQPTPAPFPPDAKIGFIDMQVIVSGSKLGKVASERMKALTDQRDADLSSKSKQMQALQQEIQTQGSVLSAAALAQKNSDLDKLQRAGQFAQQDWAAQVDTLDKQLLEDFQAKVLPVLENVRAEMGLLAIFTSNQSGALAIHPGLNLSGEVIKRLDAKYPGGK